MSLKNCRHWIFDMDGTLTLPVHDFNAIRRQLGMPADTPILEAIMEMPAPQAMACQQRLHDIEMELAGVAVAQPGVAELLSNLSAMGCKLGVLTRNHEDIAVATLQASGLAEFFNQRDIVGRQRCAPKPLPDGVNLLLNQWSVVDFNAVMVGDYLYDIEAGRRAGIQTIHFDSQQQFSWPQLTDYQVSRIADIGRLIGKHPD